MDKIHFELFINASHVSRNSFLRVKRCRISGLPNKDIIGRKEWMATVEFSSLKRVWNPSYPATSEIRNGNINLIWVLQNVFDITMIYGDGSKQGNINTPRQKACQHFRGEKKKKSSNYLIIYILGSLFFFFFFLFAPCQLHFKKHKYPQLFFIN